jgi:Superfamily I DNA and RNA helicases
MEHPPAQLSSLNLKVSADADQEHVAESFLRERKVLVEAPPGTGKTFTAIYLGLVAARAGIAARHRPSIIVTFSNNARAQVEAELARFRERKWITHDDVATVKITNYHQLYLELLNKRRGVWGCTSLLHPASEAERDGRIVTAARLAGYELRDKDRQQIGHASLFSPDPGRPSSLVGELKAQALEGLRAGRPHYDDFAQLIRRLLSCSPSLVSWLRTFGLVILDEFQDTDDEQWEILKLWGPRNVAVFFDRFQMIYGWRGARPERPAAVISEFGIINTLPLTTLHRSSGVADLPRFIVDLRADELRGSKVASQARSWLQVVPIGTNPPRKHTDCARDAIRWKVTIERLETTAVLTRHNDLAVFLQASLSSKPVTTNGPYFRCSLVGGPRAAEETLRDAIYRLRHLTGREELCEWAGQLLDDLNLGPYRQNTRKVVFSRELTKPAGKILLKSSGLLATVRPALQAWVLRATPRDIASVRNCLLVILSTARELASRGAYPDPDRSFYMRQLIARCATLPSDLEWEEFCDSLEGVLLAGKHFRALERTGLTICTVHQSKGREFDHVIVPWLSADFPEQYVSIDDDRRLLYVALTRARRRVTIVYPAESPSPLLSDWSMIESNSEVAVVSAIQLPLGFGK